MTTKLFLVLKKLALPLVIVYTLALTIGSLIHLGDIPSLGSSFDDKIYHFIAYFLFTLLVYNYCISKKVTNGIAISGIVVILYGIIIEVLQHILTSYRAFDLYDAVANALGVILAVVLLLYINNLKLKIN
jgi:VanZ family protein